MIGDCQTLTLTGQIEKIRASYARSSGAVTAIKYYKGSASKTYGTLLSLFQEWSFTETNQLIGLYGRIDTSGINPVIKQIGFITLDSELEQCPVTESVSEGTVEGEETSETTSTGETSQTESSTTSTESTSTATDSSDSNSK